MARDLKQRDEMILRLNREKEAAALQVRELRKALDAILRQLELSTTADVRALQERIYQLQTVTIKIALFAKTLWHTTSQTRTHSHSHSNELLQHKLGPDDHQKP